MLGLGASALQVSSLVNHQESSVCRSPASRMLAVVLQVECLQNRTLQASSPDQQWATFTTGELGGAFI